MRHYAAAILIYLGLVTIDASADQQLASSVSAPSSSSCVWYADDDTIRQVDTASNEIRTTIPLANPHRLVMNGNDCGVWALPRQDRLLLRYDAAGNLEQRIALRQLDSRLSDVDHIDVDASDGSLWFSDGRWLAHMSGNGEKRAFIALPFQPRQLVVALDRSVWLLGERSLLQFDATGTVLQRINHLQAPENAQRLILDQLHDRIWMVGSRRAIQFDLKNLQSQPLRVVQLPDEIAAASLNPYSGELWLATHRQLVSLAPDGSQINDTALSPLGLKKPETLAFDPVSRSLWAGFERNVVRFNEAGQPVIAYAAHDSDEALGVPALRIAPVITVLRPVTNGVTNDPRPQMQVGYDALCNGTPCGFDKAYFGDYQVLANLNNASVGNQFVFDPTSATSSFTPTQRLPEGSNAFSAQAKDHFGQLSQIASIAFMIDTVAPQLINVTPTNGSVFSEPAVTIQGQANEPAAIVFENIAQLNGQGINPQNNSFNWAITLAPGVNTAMLSAIDLAGNTASQSLQLTYTPTLDFSIESPTSDTINDDAVLVSGTFSATGPLGITVNGIAAALNGHRFLAVVPLTSGSNTITVTATAIDGLTKTKTLTLTANDSPIKIRVSPSPALAGVPVTFEVHATTPIVRIEADYNGDGISDQTVTDAATKLQFQYATPGVYQAKFNVTDSNNQALQKTMIVVVQDPGEVDRMLKSMWGGFTGALTRGNKVLAMRYLNSMAQRKYGPALDVLLPRMAEILSRQSPLRLISLSDGLAEYALTKNVRGTNRVYLIYFLRDADAVWRIDAL